MCSQSGNIQDPAACSGHSPSCIVGSDIEPDSSSRQDYPNHHHHHHQHHQHQHHHQPSLPSDMGLRYMIPATDDVR
ncbi:hypothetical protein BGZ57DRAFT_762779 [Hyaloscypha finlandica]|nr:hypothetical protein F5882DRAFT_309845 [Hyaloscypha sp. PMI_1271]KAH8775182.1 hypothetical protein BGZ57DRAFT_762779 [Hyaloscypha finlandica]